MFVVKAEDPSLDSLAMCFAVIISQDNLLGDSLLYIYLVPAFKSGVKESLTFGPCCSVHGERAVAIVLKPRRQVQTFSGEIDFGGCRISGGGGGREGSESSIR